jgi:nitrite reductase (NADH) large subunit
MKKYVIIGNGAAGANAADEIRKADPEGSINIFTEEAYGFYYRPKLPDLVAGSISLESFTMHDPSFYQEKNIDLHLNTKIVSIHPLEKTIQDSAGRSYPYDELLIASGAESNIPPLPGTNKKNVFALRTAADAIRFQEAAKDAKKVKNVPSTLLIGGGLLGLEAGKGILELGLKVEVIEFFDRLLPRQMDSVGAKILQAQLEKMGFSFRLGAKVKEIFGGESAQSDAEGIILESGEQISEDRIAGDLILFSAGIKPHLDLAKSIGLEINKSIMVNANMQTSISNIFAAGDAAEFNGMPGGIWPVAMQQGRCAGINMSGGNVAYKPIPPSIKLKVAGINLVSTGNIDAENTLKSAVCKNNEHYRKIVTENGLIKGFIFLGNIDGVNQCTAAMNNLKNVDAFFEEMQKEDFNWKMLDSMPV